MSESPEPSRKRSRKAKLVPRECIEYDENNSSMQEPELAVQALLPKLRTGIDRDDEAFANPAPAPMEFSINVEVEEFEEEDALYDEAEEIPNDKSLKQCVIEESVIRRDIEELSQTTTSLADKQLEIEIKNHWGRILKPIQDTPFEAAIQQAVNKWRVWNAMSKFRDSFLQYKCYICEKGWWHLMPFQDHIKEHDGVKVGIEVCHHECNMIAYYKQEENMRDILIEGDCWKCLKTLEEHIASKRRSNVYYFCDACNGNFFTCSSLMEHEGVCQKYHKVHLKNTVRHETDWQCNICNLNCLTKMRYENHFIRRHSVRSDLVIATTATKYCVTCDGKYMSYNLHICCRKPDNYQCTYCCRRFQSKYLASLHECMTKNGYYCPICNKYMKKQCMELEHMVKHSRNYMLAYKCALCEENILFPNEHSLRRHRVIWHGIKHDKRRGYLNVMVVPRKSLNCTNLEIVASVQGNFTIVHPPETTTPNLPPVAENKATNSDADKKSCKVKERDIVKKVILDDVQRMQETERAIDDSADIKNEIEEADNAITSLLQETLNNRRDSVDLGTDTFEGVEVKTEIKTEKEDYEEYEEETADHHNNYEDIDIDIKKEQEEYMETLSKVFQASKSVAKREMSTASLLKEELTRNEQKSAPENRSLLRVQYKKVNVKLMNTEKNLTQGRSVLLQELLAKDKKTAVMKKEKNLTQSKSVSLHELLNKDKKTVTNVHEVQSSSQTVNEKRNSSQTVNEKRNSSQTVNEKRNSSQTVNEKRNSSQTVNEKRNSSQTVNENRNSSQTVNENRNSSQTVHEKLNSSQTVNENRNSSQTVHEKLNSSQTVNENRNSSQTVHEKLNSSQTVNEKRNSSQTVHEKLNSSQTVNEKRNSYQVVFEKETERKKDECIISPRVYVRKPRKPKVPNTSQLQEELLLAEKAFGESNKTVSELIDAPFVKEELTVNNISTQISNHITGELILPTTLMRDHHALEKVFQPSKNSITLQDVETFINDEVVIKNEPMDDDEYEEDIIVLKNSFDSVNTDNATNKLEPRSSDITSETSVPELEHMSNLEPDIRIKIGRNKKKILVKRKQRKTYKCASCAFEAHHKEYQEHKINVCPPQYDNATNKLEPRSSDITSETSVPELEHMSNLEPDIGIKIGRNKKKILVKRKQRKTYKCASCAFEAHHKEYQEHKINVCPPQYSSQPGKVCVPEKNVWKQYPCTKCNEIHASLRSYAIHFSRVHYMAKFACPQCVSVQTTTSELMAHIISHIKLSFVRIHMIRESACVTTRANGVFSCKECSESVRFREFFSHWEAHMRIKVAKDEVESSGETEEVPSGKDSGLSPDKRSKVIEQLTVPWERHQRTYTLGDKIKCCVLCERAFLRRNDVKRHLIEHLLSDAFSNKWRHHALRCQVCGAKFQKSDKYKQHLRQHGSLPLYKCELCNHAFSDSSNFAKHKKVHNLRCMVCDICGKKFTAKAHLQRHIEWHAANKPIDCSSCNKFFYSESAYKKHRRSAHDKNLYKHPFMCVICQMRFPCLKEKWDHMWHVHKERKFKADCPFCDHSFRKFSDVKRHVRETHHIRLMRSKDDETVIMYEYGC